MLYIESFNYKFKHEVNYFERMNTLKKQCKKLDLISFKENFKFECKIVEESKGILVKYIILRPNEKKKLQTRRKTGPTNGWQYKLITRE